MHLFLAWEGVHFISFCLELIYFQELATIFVALPDQFIIKLGVDLSLEFSSWSGLTIMPRPHCSYSALWVTLPIYSAFIGVLVLSLAPCLKTCCLVPAWAIEPAAWCMTDRGLWPCIGLFWEHLVPLWADDLFEICLHYLALEKSLWSKLWIEVPLYDFYSLKSNLWRLSLALLNLLWRRELSLW